MRFESKFMHQLIGTNSAHKNTTLPQSTHKNVYSFIFSNDDIQEFQTCVTQNIAKTCLCVITCLMETAEVSADEEK